MVPLGDNTLLVSDFVKNILIQNMGMNELRPSTELLRFLKILESDLNKTRITRMKKLCMKKIEETRIDDFEILCFGLELLLLKISNNRFDKISIFIDNMNLESGAVDPLLVARIAVYARVTRNDTLLRKLRKHLKAKEKNGRPANLFYNLSKLIATENSYSEQKEVDYLLNWFLKKQPLDDEFLYLYGICVMNGILGYPSQEEIMNKLMETINKALTHQVGTIISTKREIVTDSKTLNLLVASDILDRESRRACLGWVEDVDSSDMNRYVDLCREQPGLLLRLSKYLTQSKRLLNEIDADENLLLSYWIGAALILLEVGVTRKIESMDKRLYKKLKNKKAKFDEKLQEFEKITTASVKGILTRNFYRIRSSVVHGETGLSLWDLEVITNIVTDYLRRIL